MRTFKALGQQTFEIVDRVGPFLISPNSSLSKLEDDNTLSRINSDYALKRINDRFMFERLR